MGHARLLAGSVAEVRHAGLLAGSMAEFCHARLLAGSVGELHHEHVARVATCTVAEDSRVYEGTPLADGAGY